VETIEDRAAGRRHRSRYRQPTLAWSFDQAAIDAEAATNGWYALLSNLPPDDADTTQVLIIYKGQEAVERRYSAFKGPSPSPPSTSRTTGVSPH
jgi:hypothetical protein